MCERLIKMKMRGVILPLSQYVIYLCGMKKAFFLILIMCLPYAVVAQEAVGVSLADDDTGVVNYADIPIRTVPEVEPAYSFDMPGHAFMPLHSDSLMLPRMNMYGQTVINAYPLYGAGWTDWSLHKGLNVNIGTSVFAVLGKHSPYKGAGFGQNISMMYAIPVTNKLSIALGGYFANTSWSHDSYRDAGFNAVLGYRFDEHWEAYIFGQKSLVNKRMPLPLYDVSGLGDRIGAAVKYNFSPSFSIQVSVSSSKYNVPSYSESDMQPVTMPGRIK